MHLPAAPGRQGGLQLLVYQLGVRLLCAGEQQEPVAVQQLAKDGQDGGTSGYEQRLGSSITRSGRPAADVLRRCGRDPAGQASMSASMVSVDGSLAFRRIMDVPFQTCVAALDSWQRTGCRELRVGESQLHGPVEHDRKTGTRRIQVRLARGSLRPLLRMRLDIDRWSASSTVVELIPCGRVRPTAAYFRAGHLLLDLLTRLLLQYVPAAVARDTASQPHVPVSSGRP
jgi:hypothetical protein